MDLLLSDDQELLLGSARALFAAKVNPDRLHELEASEAGYDPDLWDTFCELGWTTVGVPEACGGSGGSVLDLGLLLIECGRNAIASPLLQTVTSSLLAQRVGDTSAASQLVEDVASSGARVVLADTSEAERRPVARTHGAGLLLTGGPLLVEWAVAAGTIVVPAASPEGVVLAIVSRTTPGVEIVPTTSFDTERVAFVRLEEVHVDADALLTSAPLPSVRWEDERALGRLLRACEMLGTGERALEMTVEYMKVRKQFGVELGTLQAVQHICAEMRIQLDSAQLLTCSALWRATCGLPFATHAAMAAFLVRRAVDRVLPAAAQLHGGIGFTKEYPLHFYYRRAKAQGLRLGTVRAQLAEIADRVLPSGGESFRSGLMDWTVSEPQQAVTA